MRYILNISEFILEVAKQAETQEKRHFFHHAWAMSSYVLAASLNDSWESRQDCSFRSGGEIHLEVH